MNTTPLARIYGAFVSPKSLSPLTALKEGLLSEDGTTFRFIDSNSRVIDFIEPFAIRDTYDRANLDVYNSHNSTEIYSNFLSWLFETFDEDEQEFRRKLVDHLNLSENMKILITGCGLGDDVSIVNEAINHKGEIHAQDLSRAMVLEAAEKNKVDNVVFSVSNGNSLPYASRYFDAVFHFGGINLFGDTKSAILELERVCKIGGRVLFGDEGISPHLRGTQYADIAIKNNGLWSTETPTHLLPHNADGIQINYILGNCFYLIGFTPMEGFPAMDIDVPHKGIRGGTARTRYFGQLEGVTEATKLNVISKAKELNVSIHSLLERLINSQI